MYGHEKDRDLPAWRLGMWMRRVVPPLVICYFRAFCCTCLAFYFVLYIFNLLEYINSSGRGEGEVRRQTSSFCC